MSIVNDELKAIERNLETTKKELSVLKSHSCDLNQLDEALPAWLIYSKRLYAYSDCFSLNLHVKGLTEETILQEIFQPIRNTLIALGATPDRAISREFVQQMIQYIQPWLLSTKYKITINVLSHESPDCTLVEETVIEKRWRLECSQPIEE